MYIDWVHTFFNQPLILLTQNNNIYQVQCPSVYLSICTNEMPNIQFVREINILFTCFNSCGYLLSFCEQVRFLFRVRFIEIFEKLQLLLNIKEYKEMLIMLLFYLSL